MVNQHPVSQQIDRGTAFFEAALAEICLEDGPGQEDFSVQTGTLRLDEQWGAFTHFSLQARVGGYAIGRGGQCYDPMIEVALLLDPEVGDTGYVSTVGYEAGRSISAADISKTHHFTRRGVRQFKPTTFGLEYRSLSEPMRPGDSPTDDIILAYGAKLGTSDEMRASAQVLTRLLKHGIGFLESLGSAGLVEELREEQAASPISS